MTDTTETPSPPPPMPSPPPSARSWLRMPGGDGFSAGKAVLLAFLALATLVPNALVYELILEREARQMGVQGEVARSWGPDQLVGGPVLVVPVEVAADRPRLYLKVAPARLEAAATMAPQARKRGIFPATVYDARVDLSGAFAIPTEARLRAALPDGTGRLLWEEAVLSLSLTSPAGLRREDPVAIGGARVSWIPCRELARTEADCRGRSVLLAPAALGNSPEAGASFPFEAALSLRGSGSLRLAFAGPDVEARMTAPWPTPSFVGDLLPVDQSVTGDAFSARWQSAGFGAPRVWSAATIGEAGAAGAGATGTGGAATAGAASTTIGVELLDATPVYRMISRVAKYGLLTVILAFATYMFFELLSRLRIHLTQYGLVAVSLSLFPLLLLSLAEPIGYAAGYGASAGLVLAQASLYTAAIARRAGPALVFAALLAGLFGFLYVLLSLETYSLLVGALALFAMLSLLMALSQRVERTRTAQPVPAAA